MSLSISRKNILKILSDAGVPLSLPEITVALDSSGKKQSELILSHLNALIKSGTIIRNRRNRFALSDRMDMVTGRVSGHRDGFGFVERSGEGPDLYLTPREMQRVLHGDKVLARVKQIDSRGRHEGTLVALIEQGPRHLVGRFVQDRGMGYVVPDDSRYSVDVAVHPDDQAGALDGQIVVVEITSHPFEKRRLAGRVVECIGDHLAPGMETEIAIRKHEIPWEWPDDVLDAIAHVDLGDATVIPQQGRRDLSDVPLVTIDGADAKDFDDAVAARSTEDGGWTLWVAIADVSHYVMPGDSLDSEAVKRGNSVYFPGRVIPMLPEALSNGICSLKPNVARYALVCEMQVARDGAVTDYSFYPGLIRSRARLTYEAAQEFLAGGEPLTPDREVDESLNCLAKVFRSLRNQRFAAGSLDLDIPEPVFHFGSDRRIESVGVRRRLDAHRLIEECMLAANVCAAQFIDGGVGMYRIHDQPDADRINDLRRVYQGFGIRVSNRDELGPADLMAAVAAAREQRPDVVETLQMLVLRAMRQAVYSTKPSVHFALGFEHYTHFTSPIRRYPDLVVHRLIKKRLGNSSIKLPDADSLEHVAEHCSVTERRAEEATRDVYGWLKAEFMQDHIGESFDGRVTAITQFGVFVTLDDLFIDGLIHISELGKDYFRFDPVRLELTGERSGRVIRLGNAMRIQVAGVDLDEGHVNFVPADNTSSKRRSAKWDKT
ncbi:MAG: ribonuclease R [marine bacterium B5-7]|nr:MAG: ribonuclease R [marine bacterium B5-7]